MKKIQCGGFYVDDEAIETREGKPFLKTGGSDPIVDPIVENAKQTGGIGWTESGEQTVITWDGDTEGRVVIPAGSNSYIVKVSDKVPSYDELIDSEIVKNTGETAIVSADNVTHTDEYISFAVDSYFMCFVALNDNITVSGVQLPERGVYFSFFSGRYISSLTYGTPDTIHKIDEKYLPASGGVMVVNIEREYDTMVADKPFDEVYSAWKTGCVIARVDTGNGIVDLRPLTDVVTDTTTGLVFTGVTYTAEHGILYKLNWGSFSGVEKFMLGVRNLQLTGI